MTDQREPQPLTADELARLREVAQAATPGPWHVSRYFENGADGELVRIAESGKEPLSVAVAYAWVGSRTVSENIGNAYYIASFDPPTVLRLLDQLAAAEKLLAQFLEAVDDAWRDDNDPQEIMIDGSWVDATRRLLGGPYDDDDDALPTDAAPTPASERGE